MMNNSLFIKNKGYISNSNMPPPIITPVASFPKNKLPIIRINKINKKKCKIKYTHFGIILMILISITFKVGSNGKNTIIKNNTINVLINNFISTTESVQDDHNS